ncbi:MAG: PDZ domain-containing protein [Acidobacteria bacterium]|nr:PDZ domain-containing protein [Acidobacteriota bacterium]
MRSRMLLSLLALGLIVATTAAPALAGEYKKCPFSTQECLDKMTTKMKNSGWVGVELEMDEDTGATMVTRVIPGSPAESAGIRTGDRLAALNGVPIKKGNDEALAKQRKDWKPGQSVTYTIQRDGMDRQVSLTLAPMPADVLAAWVGRHMLEHVSTDVASK